MSWMVDLRLQRMPDLILPGLGRCARQVHGVAVGLVLALLLVGCASQDMSDLEAQVDGILKRPPDRLKPLPEVQPYRAYAYVSGKAAARDPYRIFFLRDLPQASGNVTVDTGLTPEMEREIKDRNREDLEYFELDALEMLGFIQDEEDFWGIIGDPDGVVHPITVGNYLGKNFGKVTEVAEDKIVLRELVKDNSGRWEERAAQLVILN